jgi:hypothetical protein
MAAAQNQWVEATVARKESKYRLQSPSSSKLMAYVEDKGGLLGMRLAPAVGTISGAGVVAGPLLYPDPGPTAFPLMMTRGLTTLEDIKESAHIV